MKKLFTLFLLLTLILCGCSGQPAETTAPPTTEAPTEAPTTVPPTTVPPTTEAPTEAPTEPPVPTNPLTGEVLEAPLETRIFASTINNVHAAMPTYGVSDVDLFFEMFVNNHMTRGLAMFSDIRKAGDIGSVRSLRYNFTDLCETFDAIVVHAGGYTTVMNDLAKSPVENISVEAYAADFYFRDKERYSRGYAWEHCLFINGPKIYDFAESEGMRVTQDPDKDYGLRFTEDGTPVNGEDAKSVTIQFIHTIGRKDTNMLYNEDTGLYQFRQYGIDMWDVSQGEAIRFKNVIVMLTTITDRHEGKATYHIAELLGEGEGYFACGGKIIPIKWSHESMDAPILFTLEDGTPLELGVGSSYIAIAPVTSVVEYE